MNHSHTWRITWVAVTVDQHVIVRVRQSHQLMCYQTSHQPDCPTTGKGIPTYEGVIHVPLGDRVLHVEGAGRIHLLGNSSIEHVVRVRTLQHQVPVAAGRILVTRNVRELAERIIGDIHPFFRHAVATRLADLVHTSEAMQGVERITVRKIVRAVNRGR